MKTKAFPEANLPPDIQAKADRMNLDESAVPPYTPLDITILPEMSAAEKDRNALTVLQTFAEKFYGEIPPRCQKIEFIQTASGKAFNGCAVRREFDIVCTNNGVSRTLHLLLYTPANAVKKVPCFLGLNFMGNTTVSNDPEVTFYPINPYPDPSPWRNDNRARTPEEKRGVKAYRWEFEKVLKRGFASATLCLGDAQTDHPTAYKDGIMPLFYSEDQHNSPERKSAAISAWAWGLMRAVDLLESLDFIDRNKIIVHGLSRLGKAAIWAGANDRRIAMTVSFCSGTAGAKMSRRYFGENMEWLDNWHKDWFVPGFEKYIGNDTQMPFDQQQLMAVIAPRKLYVASAVNDLYADPQGEFLATRAASAAWGKDGIAQDVLRPVPGNGIGNEAVRYFIRNGEHDCLPENWDDLLDFAAKHFL